MSDRFTLSGGYGTEPLGGTPSFDPAITSTINEVLNIVQKKCIDIPLTVDTPVAIDFAVLTKANIILLKSVGGASVRARITSGDGSQQAIPFDTFLILMSMEKEITAIDLTRTPATETTVRVFLGQED